MEKPDTAVSVAKTSVSLFIVTLFAKSAGLLVASLIARYLGAAALGTYAMVMGIALLLEVIVPLGQNYVVIREVARDRSRMFTYWVNASLVTLASAITLGIMLILLTRQVSQDPTIRASAYVVGLYLPIAGLYYIAQSILIGIEQVEYQSIAVFGGGFVYVLVVWILLVAGVGVITAFVGYGLFLFTAWLIMAWALLQQGEAHGGIRNAHPDLNLCREMLRISFPFAIQNFLAMALNRVNALILPVFITMEMVGMFDAADRVRQTSTVIVPIVNMAILPALSRTIVANPRKSVLSESALKLLLTITFPFVFTTVVMANRIVPLLYGLGYEAAIPVLQIVICSQVFFVADSVLKQIMMASNNERAMVWRTALAIGTNVILILFLTPPYGLAGAAWAVVLTQALNLGLDVQFVFRNVCRIKLTETVGKPLLCTVLSGGIALTLSNQGLIPLLFLTAGSYVVFLLIFRIFSPDEFLVLRRLSRHLWQKVVVWK